jgi:hypothetical protein
MSRRVALLAAVGALVAVGSLQAATTATDPIIGTWKVTKGGSGTFTVRSRSGVLAFTSTARVRVGCLQQPKGNVIGFADLPSRTKLPKGQYNGNFGVDGSGCYYNVRLKLRLKTLTGTVLYSDNEQPGGPFTFTKVK